MKKLFSIIISLVSAVLCLCLTACGDKPDTQKLAGLMKEYMTGSFQSDDYYIQLSRTGDKAHTITEVSKMGDDKCFLAYDVNGEIKYFRNGKLTTVSAGTLYAPEEKDADWDDFNYGKTADNYRNVLLELCSDTDEKLYKIKEIKYEDSGNEDLPYKVSVFYDLSKFDCKKLFGSQGNFGIMSIKFLTDLKGSRFDNITLHVQYDYNSEIFVSASSYGQPKTPEQNNGNGQRPDDIEEMYHIRADQLQNSFEEYLQSMQEQLST